MANTTTIDHIIYLAPTGLDSVTNVTHEWENLGFRVIPGGTHADGLTANALVILQDSVYIELIAFLHPPSHYPEGSAERALRESHQWAEKPTGWVDYSFLGLTEASPPLSKIINDRAARENSGTVYRDEVKGGRERPDGKVLKWVITHPAVAHGRGNVPFFCEDTTPREWRVPSDPKNATHANKSIGIHHLALLAGEDDISRRVAQLTSALGTSPSLEGSRTRRGWSLRTGTGGSSQIVLNVPQNEDEKKTLASKGPGLYSVAFTVSKGEAARDEGAVSWVPET